MLTLSLHGHVRVCHVAQPPDDSLLNFFWLRDEYSRLYSAVYYWDYDVDYYYSERLANIDSHITWLREQKNISQMPAGFRPYALELADMFEVLQLIVSLRREAELPSLSREQMAKLISALDYETLSALPWPELTAAFPDLPAVTFYSQWFDGSFIPSEPILRVAEDIQVPLNIEHHHQRARWSADGRWLSLTWTELIGEHGQLDATMLFHPETNTSSMQTFPLPLFWVGRITLPGKRTTSSISGTSNGRTELDWHLDRLGGNKMRLIKRKQLLAIILVLVIALAVWLYPRGDEPLAYDLYERGRFAEAAAQFGKLLEQDPHNWEFIELRARALFQAGDMRAWTEAIAEIIQSPKTLPESMLDLLDECALYYYQKGYVHHALEYWQLAAARGYSIESSQYRELQLTFGLYGHMNLDFSPNLDDTQLHFAWLISQYSDISAAIYHPRYSSSHWEPRQQFLARELLAIDEHITWLLNQDNLSQIPEDLRPYALELADMFEVVKLTVSWHREGKFPPLKATQMNMLLYLMDYESLIPLPWTQLTASFPELSAVTYYKQLFSNDAAASDPAWTVDNLWQIPVNDEYFNVNWSADGQWLSLTWNKAIAPADLRSHTTLYNPLSGDALELEGSFRWAPNDSVYMLCAVDKCRIAEEPRGAEHVINISGPDRKGITTLSGRDGDLSLEASAVWLDFYAEDRLIIRTQEQNLHTDYGLAAVTELTNDQFINWHNSRSSLGFRLHTTHHGHEIRDLKGNLLGRLLFPGRIEIVGNKAGKPVLWSESGPWQMRVWVPVAGGYTEHLLPAHLQPVKWLEGDRILCVLNDKRPLWSSYYAPPQYVVYNLATGEIQSAQLPEGSYYSTTGPDYLVWHDNGKISIGRLQLAD